MMFNLCILRLNNFKVCMVIMDKNVMQLYDFDIIERCVLQGKIIVEEVCKVIYFVDFKV